MTNHTVKSSVVILFVTHILNDSILQRIQKIKKDLSLYNYDIVLLLQNEKENLTLPNSINFYTFSENSIKSLGYIPIVNRILPGSNHFAILQFYKDFPNYSYYWNIEYDVYFNGDWNLFFSSYADITSDFLSSHIETFWENPSWEWWVYLQLKDPKIPIAQRLRSFNPIYRLSNQAINAIDKCLKQGNRGHHEILLPTLLHSLKYTINDFCKSSKFGLPFSFYKKGIYYSPDCQTGSMRYRPRINEEEITQKNILYHPYK